MLWFALFLMFAPRSVDLAWTASVTPDVVGYNIYRADTNGQPGDVLTWAKINTDPVDAEVYTDLNVVSFKIYFYKLTAVGADGVTESDYTDPVEAYMNIPVISGNVQFDGNVKVVVQ